MKLVADIVVVSANSLCVRFSQPIFQVLLEEHQKDIGIVSEGTKHFFVVFTI